MNEIYERNPSDKLPFLVLPAIYSCHENVFFIFIPTNVLIANCIMKTINILKTRNKIYLKISNQIKITIVQISLHIYILFCVYIIKILFSILLVLNHIIFMHLYSKKKIISLGL